MFFLSIIHRWVQIVMINWRVGTGRIGYDSICLIGWRNMDQTETNRLHNRTDIPSLMPSFVWSKMSQRLLKNNPLPKISRVMIQWEITIEISHVKSLKSGNWPSRSFPTVMDQPGWTSLVSGRAILWGWAWLHTSYFKKNRYRYVDVHEGKINIYIYVCMYVCINLTYKIYLYQYVPHKAVAEVPKIENL